MSGVNHLSAPVVAAGSAAAVGAATTHATSGVLAFTGFALLSYLVLGLALIGTGLVARRFSRSKSRD